MKLPVTEIKSQLLVLPDGEIIPHTTEWIFTFPEDTVRSIHSRISKDVDELWNKVMGSGIQFSCPSMGEVMEDYGWVEVFWWEDRDIESVSLNVAEGRLTIWVNNAPQDPLDRLDPQHEDWFRTNPTQWIQVFHFIKDFMKRIEK